MKKLFALLSAVLLTAFLFTSNVNAKGHKQKAKSKVNNHFTQTSRPIVVNSDKPEFSIRLKATPSTGYSWFMVDLNPRVVRIVDSNFTAPKTIRPGASGVDEWTFRILPEAFKVQHITKIKMMYAQPWNLKNAHYKTFTVITHHCTVMNKPDDKHAKIAAKKHGWMC